jgi:hypothetical protein
MRAQPAGPAQSSALHDLARSGPTKEAHRRALDRPDRLHIAKRGGSSEHPTRYVADAILEAAPLSERHRPAQLKITMRSSGKAAGSTSISAPDETTTTLGDHPGLVPAELITLPTQQQAP